MVAHRSETATTGDKGPGLRLVQDVSANGAGPSFDRSQAMPFEAPLAPPTTLKSRVKKALGFAGANIDNAMLAQEYFSNLPHSLGVANRTSAARTCAALFHVELTKRENGDVGFFDPNYEAPRPNIVQRTLGRVASRVGLNLFNFGSEDPPTATKQEAFDPDVEARINVSTGRAKKLRTILFDDQEHDLDAAWNEAFDKHEQFHAPEPESAPTQQEPITNENDEPTFDPNTATVVISGVPIPPAIRTDDEGEEVKIEQEPAPEFGGFNVSSTVIPDAASTADVSIGSAQTADIPRSAIETGDIPMTVVDPGEENTVTARQFAGVMGIAATIGLIVPATYMAINSLVQRDYGGAVSSLGEIASGLFESSQAAEIGSEPVGHGLFEIIAENTSDAASTVNDVTELDGLQDAAREAAEAAELAQFTSELVEAAEAGATTWEALDATGFYDGTDTGMQDILDRYNIANGLEGEAKAIVQYSRDGHTWWVNMDGMHDTEHARVLAEIAPYVRG